MEPTLNSQSSDLTTPIPPVEEVPTIKEPVEAQVPSMEQAFTPQPSESTTSTTQKADISVEKQPEVTPVKPIEKTEENKNLIDRLMEGIRKL